MAVETATTGVSPFVGSKDKSVGWYDKNPPELQPAALELLEKYAGVPADKVLDHVITMVSRRLKCPPSPHPFSSAGSTKTNTRQSATRPGRCAPTRAWASSASWT
jgi:hypothetical protein